jgi:GTP cyclohydrolase I/GTP cyclohydrolase-4
MRAAVSNESSQQPEDGPRRGLLQADPWTIVALQSTARRQRRGAPAVVQATVFSLSPTRRCAVSSSPRATLAGVQPIGSSTAPPALDGRGDDVQARAPRVQVGLSRVGVTGVEKVIHIRDELFFARLECFVDLSREQKGAHMSRFEEVVNEAIGEVVLSESPFRAETLAQQIAELVRTRQQAERAEVTIAARYPEHKPAPVSGIQTQEIYTLHGRAVAYAHGTRRTVGVSATGMTACPCAQELIAGRARERLLADGFDEQQVERIFDRVPVATHNQRGLATLQIGCIEECVEQIDAAALLAIAESSMSSEIYELMKRTDEVAVVEKAHRRPRFVEDCVREMVAGVVREFPQLDGRNFVSARQENLETIHQHNVVAERHGTLAELRNEIETGELPLRQTSLEQWLDAGRPG